MYGTVTTNWKEGIFERPKACAVRCMVLLAIGINELCGILWAVVTGIMGIDWCHPCQLTNPSKEGFVNSKSSNLNICWAVQLVFGINGHK